jgi:hypothetical protein
MSRYEPVKLIDPALPGIRLWVAFDTEKSVVVSKASSWSVAHGESQRLNREAVGPPPAPRPLKKVDLYRGALKLIALNSCEKYARDVANAALTGGSGDRNP